MHKDDAFFPLIIASLAVLFIMLAVLLLITRGNKQVLRRKLEIGAMLLALLGLPAGACKEVDGGGTVECYVPALPADTLLITITGDDAADGALTLDLAQSSTLEGQIEGAAIVGVKAASFAIIDQQGNWLDGTDVAIKDGSLDSNDEQFSFSISWEVPNGVYSLALFSVGIEDAKAYQPFPVKTYTLTLNSDFSQVTCYDVSEPPADQIAIDGMPASTELLAINLDLQSAVGLSISNRQAAAFSFSLTDADDAVLRSADLSAVDGVFDETNEELAIPLSGLESGEYTLRVFAASAADVAAYGTFPAKQVGLKLFRTLDN